MKIKRVLRLARKRQKYLLAFKNIFKTLYKRLGDDKNCYKIEFKKN